VLPPKPGKFKVKGWVAPVVWDSKSSVPTPLRLARKPLSAPEALGMEDSGTEELLLRSSPKYNKYALAFVAASIAVTDSVLASNILFICKFSPKICLLQVCFTEKIDLQITKVVTNNAINVPVRKKQRSNYNI
jgi:hypothetical protein